MSFVHELYSYLSRCIWVYWSWVHVLVLILTIIANVNSSLTSFNAPMSSHVTSRMVAKPSRFAEGLTSRRAFCKRKTLNKSFLITIQYQTFGVRQACMPKPKLAKQITSQGPKTRETYREIFHSYTKIFELLFRKNNLAWIEQIYNWNIINTIIDMVKT